MSPTFSLVNIYDLEKVKVWHFDLYRLKDKQEIFDLDFDVALMDCVIMEWPEIIEDYLPNKRVDIFMNEDKNFLRSVTVKKIN